MENPEAKNLVDMSFPVKEELYFALTISEFSGRDTLHSLLAAFRIDILNTALNSEKVGGPQISSANPQICGLTLNISLDLRTIRKWCILRN